MLNRTPYSGDLFPDFVNEKKSNFHKTENKEINKYVRKVK